METKRIRDYPSAPCSQCGHVQVEKPFLSDYNQSFKVTQLDNAVHCGITAPGVG